MLGNHLSLMVGYEPLLPGPIGASFAVIDYNGHTKTYYAPVDLDDTAILLRGGLDPSESDPRFHQQMVYAVASETLERFEVALGRKIHWHRAKHGPNRLNLHPHAMLEANAYYSREVHGILFGYFPAGPDADGDVLPKQTVFTCLSHDIIAHEVTHAVIDGIREHFTEPTNIDVTAFHEAFADLAALFRHFSHQDALLDTLQRTGGRLYGPSLAADAQRPGSHVNVGAEITSDNPLVELARQFGQVSGHSGGLRSALDRKSNANDIRSVTEPHARGAILVAAMFDAFFTTYVSRTADLFKVFRAGGGRPETDDLPGPLAQLLAERASKTADMFFMICARALDYCPPVDITFGDFLRALITADSDLYPVDAHDVRYAIMQAFRRRGIVPEGALYFSEEALRWPLASAALPAVTGLAFGDPNGLSREEKDINGPVLRAYAATNAKLLGFNPKHGKIGVPSFHPMFRLGEDGVLRIDMVVELIQTREIAFDKASPELGTFEVHAGVTLMIASQPLIDGNRPDPIVRYVIPRHVDEERIQRQRTAYAAGAYMTKDHRIDFSLVHGAL
ncbi:peptidase M4 [Mesorhizobium sp.]|uniref:peptidase M4 n=1 Tax=Mesorhizobium sp. TaxID=1871066 RepID=UPI000FE4682A|nr:peptidase M4 [Mesorhizobium sp.]RWE78116.1 MAG: peptidase M4 [Mesorhizobium sp.]TIV32537.1 MAG: peptidase M4 [Mesorhizobium sp.]